MLLTILLIITHYDRDRRALRGIRRRRVTGTFQVVPCDLAKRQVLANTHTHTHTHVRWLQVLFFLHNTKYDWANHEEGAKWSWVRRQGCKRNGEERMKGWLICWWQDRINREVRCCEGWWLRFPTRWRRTETPGANRFFVWECEIAGMFKCTVCVCVAHTWLCRYVCDETESCRRLIWIH